MLGCPILRALCEGWDKQNVRGRGFGCRAVVSHPSQNARRMGHPSISSWDREKILQAENPGLKSETWATHSTLVRAIFA